MELMNSPSALMLQDEPQYVNSLPGDDPWGQPSSLCYAIRVQDGAIYGSLISPARRSFISPALPGMDPGPAQPAPLEPGWILLAEEAQRSWLRENPF